MLRAIFMILSFYCLVGTAKTTVIFGDSLSDEGRLFERMQNTFPDPTYYAQGRFSNGPVWTEYAFADRQNFSYGGALADHNNIFTPILGSIVENTGVFDQIDQYFAQSPTDIADTAFIIYVGSNDLYAITDFDDPNTPSSIIEIIDEIEQSLVRLKEASATDITVVGLPDLSFTPFVQYAASDVQQWVISRACSRFNRKLQELAAEYEIDYFATDLLMKTIIENPAAFNLVNVTESCLTMVEDQIVVCKDPASYLFWDGVHPTTDGHRLFAQAFVQ